MGHQEKQKHIKRCRFSFPHYEKGRIEYQCLFEGYEDDEIHTCTEEECEQCEKYDSRYIEYPLTIKGIENRPIEKCGFGHTVGCMVAVRPCGEEYGEKTYLGIYLGELPIQIMTSYDPTTGVLTNSAMQNPGIFVPELKKIVYGCGSWWREIKSVDELKAITDEDIENTWYVQLLQNM